MPSQEDINEEEREQERFRNEQNNLIMFNVPESDDARDGDREYYDFDRVDQVLRNGIEINNIEIQEVVR